MKVSKELAHNAFYSLVDHGSKECQEIADEIEQMEDGPVYIIPETKMKTYLAHKQASEAHRSDVLELLHVFRDITNLTSGKGMTSIISMFTTNKKPLETFAARINAVAEKYVTNNQNGEAETN